MALNENIRKNQLPKFECMMEKKEYEELCTVFKENKTGLDYIDEHVYVKMFGYKDVDDYYKHVSVDNFSKNITVPLFGFGAIDD